MSVPTQIFGYTYPKVMGTVNWLQDLAMEYTGSRFAAWLC